MQRLIPKGMVRVMPAEHHAMPAPPPQFSPGMPSSSMLPLPPPPSGFHPEHLQAMHMLQAQIASMQQQHVQATQAWSWAPGMPMAPQIADPVLNLATSALQLCMQMAQSNAAHSAAMQQYVAHSAQMQSTLVHAAQRAFPPPPPPLEEADDIPIMIMSPTRQKATLQPTSKAHARMGIAMLCTMLVSMACFTLHANDAHMHILLILHTASR